MAGLQAAQELPGFLLHEELVFGAPTGHHLPGAGHLGGDERVSSVTNPGGGSWLVRVGHF